MSQAILYLKDHKGKLRFWSITSHEDGIETEFGCVGGEIQSTMEYIEPKSNRTLAEQIQSEMNSRVKKRMEKGYVLSIDEALNRIGAVKNEIGLPRPMLAQKFDDEKIDPRYYYKQPKLDGHRCIIYKDGNNVQAYSRNGKVIDSITEIIDHVRKLPIETITLDGELYHHGTPLQQITSLVKRRQVETSSLTYWAYDIISQAPFKERTQELNSVLYYAHPDFIMNTPTTLGVRNIVEELAVIKSMGFEGLMLRHPDAGYEEGVRSKSLLKVKSRFDDEFVVVDITKNKIGGAILHCLINDKVFGTPAPGTQAMKEQVLKFKDDYIGRYVRVEYANLTKDGIPFHPVATMWRDKGDE
jgi:DNA ligase 1